jgi:hypothetical protein
MASPRKLGPYKSEYYFFEAFKLMQSMVKEIYNERGKRRGQIIGESESSVKVEGGRREGGGRSEPFSPSSSSSSTDGASEHSSKNNNSTKHIHYHDKP